MGRGYGRTWRSRISSRGVLMSDANEGPEARALPVFQRGAAGDLRGWKADA